jgi:hypothetical protein
MAKKHRQTYKNNPRLKAEGVQIALTAEQDAEFDLCMEDPIYFIKNYVKIVHVDKGVVPFKMYDYQERYVNMLHNNRYNVLCWPRQSGKSTTTAAYIVHYLLFNSDKTAFILANKAATSREILSRVQKAYENLPFWLQQGVLTWNKGSIELENGAKCQAHATSSSAIRGCVSGQDKVTIKDKVTGETSEVTMEELAFLLNKDKEEVSPCLASDLTIST